MHSALRAFGHGLATVHALPAPAATDLGTTSVISLQGVLRSKRDRLVDKLVYMTLLTMFAYSVAVVVSTLMQYAWIRTGHAGSWPSFGSAFWSIWTLISFLGIRGLIAFALLTS
jgi:hypothetical protein